MVDSDTSDSSCLGLKALDKGHNLVPEPPDNITGTITLYTNPVKNYFTLIVTHPEML
jgi:hypothetical protein